MIYILEQRLQAQNISAEKSRKVISDVTKTMFNQQFVQELVKPQKLYNSESVREIFNKLAHSSIMKLSTASMDKLYDLMLMGFKHAIVECKQPQELLQVTLNHFDSIERLLAGGDAEPMDCLTHAITSMLEVSTKMGIYDYYLLRHKLACFFQDKNVKVSLFLTSGVQNRNDGSFVLSVGNICPYGFDSPGSVRYFSEQLPSESDKISHPLERCKVDESLNYLDTTKRSSKHGLNLYMQKDSNVSHAPQQTVVAPTDTKQAQTPEQKKSTQTHLELNYLASLIGGANSATKDDSKFKINLFPDNNAAETDANEASKSSDHEVITFDQKQAKSNALSGLMDEAESTSNNQDDDLLDLMDSAN
ncbi:OSCP1 [Acrasis kona]|uniref:OSCP1 n=1 Tax=Acrasis kona TaxID=1008807 RepID=A0AAW2YMT1_9EUKA